MHILIRNDPETAVWGVFVRFDDDEIKIMYDSLYDSGDNDGRICTFANSE